MRTRSTLLLNIDRKLAGTLVSGAVVYALTRLLHLDATPDVRAAISAAAAFAVGYLLPPSETAQRRP